MPWTTTTTPAQSWATVTNSAATWRGSGSPSHASRLNAVYPLPVNPAGDLDYVWRIQSEGFFVIATGNGVQIKSRITDGP